MNLESLKHVPIFSTLISLLVDRLNTDRVYKDFPEDLIIFPRWFYYGKAVKRVPGLRMESVPWTYETVLSIVNKISRDNKDLSILDYWCGQHKSAYLRKFFWDESITSADILDFADMGSFLRINPNDSVINIPDKSFDLVISSEVIEHVRNPFVLMDELLRLSKRYLIITTPNPRNLYSRSIFSKSWYFQWFEPKDFDYHKTPIFSWQIEDFLIEKWHSYERYANHEYFWLWWDQIEKWETLIYFITVN